MAAPRAPFVTIGLIGEQPDAALAAARDAFTSGAADAETRALAVTSLMDGAVAIGQSRVTSAAVALAIVVLLLIVLALVRRRRRRRLAVAAAAVSDPSPASLLATEPVAEVPDRPATLADVPDRPAPYGTLADPTAERVPPLGDDPPRGEANGDAS